MLTSNPKTDNLCIQCYYAFNQAKCKHCYNKSEYKPRQPVRSTNEQPSQTTTYQERKQTAKDIMEALLPRITKRKKELSSLQDLINRLKNQYDQAKVQYETYDKKLALSDSRYTDLSAPKKKKTKISSDQLLKLLKSIPKEQLQELLKEKGIN